MIEKVKDGYVLFCEVCWSSPDIYDTFQDAVKAKKAEGIRSFKDENDRWYDACENCLPDVQITLKKFDRRDM